MTYFFLSTLFANVVLSLAFTSPHAGSFLLDHLNLNHEKGNRWCDGLRPAGGGWRAAGRGALGGRHAAAQAGSRNTALLAELVTHYEELSVPTLSGISLIDITSRVGEVVKKSEAKEGVVTVMSRHSTVGVMIQEMEGRFVDDARQFLHKLAPPNYPYLHNDLDFRVGPPGWPGGDEAWRAFRAKEPVNAHSHLLAMVIGTSESIPIHQSAMRIGTYQNIIVVDADGCAPGGNQKKRTICIQITGSK